MAHKVYGVANSLNSANYIYFKALERTHKLNNPKAIQVFMEEMIALHKGQGFDIWWRDSVICPTIEEYKQMVIDSKSTLLSILFLFGISYLNQKETGGLFRLAVRLMQAFSEDKK